MLHMCEGPEKHVTITTEVEIINLYKKLQELLHVLRSKIILDMRDLPTPESQHEVNIDTEPQIRPEFDETRALPQDSDSDSDSNNNHDELNIPQAEHEGGDNLRMLSILQNE